MKKSVAVVGSVGLPACYGGFESLVDNLTKEASSNISYHIFCSSKSYTNKLDKYNGAKLHYVNLKANGIQSIFYDIFSLIKCLLVIKPDTTLILGVSGCIFLPFYKCFSRSEIVTNIDGLEWKRDKWPFLVKKFLKFSEKLAVKFSNTVIADNQAITDYVATEYNVKALTIAYGGDHAFSSTSDTSMFEVGYSLALCRIEPENNVELILEAFSKVPAKKLKFIGNWGKSPYGERLRAHYSSFENIEILDPIYEVSKLFIFRSNCDFYIHGHSAGGTNPSLVESMFFKKPILAFDCIFNRHSTHNQAVYFSDVEQLVETLQKSDNLNKVEIGLCMYQIANENYRWRNIASQYELSYKQMFVVVK